MTLHGDTQRLMTSFKVNALDTIRLLPVTMQSWPSIGSNVYSHRRYAKVLGSDTEFKSCKGPSIMNLM
jgi:hypothetical protein